MRAYRRGSFPFAGGSCQRGGETAPSPLRLFLMASFWARCRVFLRAAEGEEGVFEEADRTVVSDMGVVEESVNVSG